MSSDTRGRRRHSGRKGKGCVALLPSIEFKHLRRPEGFPVKIVTLGDHIRARRLERKLRQCDAGKLIGVNTWTMMNWEKNHHQPGFRHYPSIMEFLGYCPVQRADHIGGWVRIHREHRGLSQKEAARILGIDPSTLAKYERGERKPIGLGADT